MVNTLRPWRASEGTQILGRGLSGPSIGYDFEGNLLSFIEAIQAGALNRADMHKDILAAVLGLDEAEALLTVKPLDCSRQNGGIFLQVRV